MDNKTLIFTQIGNRYICTKEESLAYDESNNSLCGFESFEDFECAGDEVLVESSPASPDMAARLAQPQQAGGPAAAVGAGGASPATVRELIVIPEISNSIHLQHAIHQVSRTVVEVNGDSSGQSSPTAEAQHTYITVAMKDPWNAEVASHKVELEILSDQESEGGNGVNYHVQYVEPQEIYTQAHQAHIEPLRSYPVYGVATVGAVGAVGAVGPAAEAAATDAWGGAAGAEYAAYGVVVAGEEAADGGGAPPSPGAGGGCPPGRMPPATVQWLIDNYETAEGVSLPRSTLYSHYMRHCRQHDLEPINAASFGKLIRAVFVGLRTRRLGTRGNSKYHYYGIRTKARAGQSPAPDDGEDKPDAQDQQESIERSPSPASGGSGGEGAGAAAQHRQYLGEVSAPDPPAIELDALPDDVPPDALELLREHHRQHGLEFLEAVSLLDTGGVERARRAFWRRPPTALPRRALARLAALPAVADWLKRADLALYQRAVDLLLPDVLRPIPPHLTQAIRNFAKGVESALFAGAGGAGGAAARAQAAAAGALAGALRRYTSLNHLAQAARAVLTNHHQIQQMLSDLNRVDFRVVREQASWACACASAAAVMRLETDFKATLGRGATLEQWASWLEACVRGALAPHERRADYTPRARRLLLDWSFYSSLVIRELTLRSASSFGSFHLIRLLYDEYVSYIIERRVAAHQRLPPIAVMHAMQDDIPPEPHPTPGSGLPDPRDVDADDPDWEWEDESDDDEPAPDAKRTKMG